MNSIRATFRSSNSSHSSLSRLPIDELVASVNPLAQWMKAIPANDKREGQHCRIELGPSTPWHIQQQALTITAPCPACGRAIYPFRRRKARSGRLIASGTVYLSVSCPISVSIKCSRGGAARLATDAIERLIAASEKRAATEQAALDL
jgi:hypothetical protein